MSCCWCGAWELSCKSSAVGHCVVKKPHSIGVRLRCPPGRCRVWAPVCASVEPKSPLLSHSLWCVHRASAERWRRSLQVLHRRLKSYSCSCPSWKGFAELQQDAVGVSSRLGNRFWWYFAKTVHVSLLDNLVCQGTLLPWLQHAPGSLFLWLTSPVCSQILTGLYTKIHAVQTNLICQAIKLRLLFHCYSGVLSPEVFSVMT